VDPRFSPAKQSFPEAFPPLGWRFNPVGADPLCQKLAAPTSDSILHDAACVNQQTFNEGNLFEVDIRLILSEQYNVGYKFNSAF
jgi:hypothetical protein